jgi:predicted nucleic acid-binding protein
VSVLVLDTDVASAVLQRRARRTLPPGATEQVLTFVTVGELTKWTLLSRWGPRRRAEMQRFLDHRRILRYDRAVATTWGELMADAQRRGRPRPVNDAWIAACCIVRGLPLMTYNTKDFEDFADHGLVLVA